MFWVCELWHSLLCKWLWKLENIEGMWQKLLTKKNFKLIQLLSMITLTKLSLWLAPSFLGTFICSWKLLTLLDTEGFQKLKCFWRLKSFYGCWLGIVSWPKIISTKEVVLGMANDISVSLLRLWNICFLSAASQNSLGGWLLVLLIRSGHLNMLMTLWGLG